MTRRVAAVLLAVSLLAPVPALAGETNVYGDPGSGDFSVGLAVAADSSGNAYVMGTFFGQFQGVSSTGWDMWIARIADDGSFAWLRTWDAPEAEQYFAGLPIIRERSWTESTYGLIVDDADRVRARVGHHEAILVSVDLDGSNPSHSFIGTDPESSVNFSVSRPTLVPDGTGDIVAFTAPEGSPDQVLVRVRPDGSLVWASSVKGDYDNPLVVTSDGTAVVGRQLDRMSFQNPAVGVTAVDSNGVVMWDTEIFDACLAGLGSPLIDMGDEVGLVISSPTCSVDGPEWVPTLSVETGERLSNRVIKDSVNIIWCDDPRLGPITEPVSVGYTDGDECGGDPVFWTDVNTNLISEGSPTDGLAIVGMEEGGSYLGYGVLRTVADGDRWTLDRFDYAGPWSSFVPWDMTMTKNGAVVVGRVSNTAWFTAQSVGIRAAADESALGAAAVVTVDVDADRTFLPDGRLIGLVDPTQGKWHLYDNLGETSFFFGNPGDYPIMGDWDCDGTETPGMYRQSDGYVYLRDSNTQGNADTKFFFGNPGDIPIAGDFNNDGCGTVSIYRPSNQTFYVINELGENNGGLGAAEFSYVFGNPGDKPFVGDFDGDGVETVGLHRETTGLVYFRNSQTQGNADNQFIFGDPGDRFVAGDWTGDGMYTPALFRPSTTTTYFRFTNTQGNANYAFTQGEPGWLPVAGSTGP